MSRSCKLRKQSIFACFVENIAAMLHYIEQAAAHVKLLLSQNNVGMFRKSAAVIKQLTE